MAFKRTHHHRCQVCGIPTECPGEWDQTFGPDRVFCAEQERWGDDFRCESCEALSDDERWELAMTPDAALRRAMERR